LDEKQTLEDHFYGSATVGDRGQVVIPAEARKKYGIHPGDKILVIAYPGGHGLMLCKIDAMREFFSSLLEDLNRIESLVASGENVDGGGKGL